MIGGEPTAVLDACVLYKDVVRDVLLNIAEAGLFRPRWTAEIQDEWTRNLKDNRPDNVPRLKAKLKKDIVYLRKAFPDYQHVLMLWSPVVRNQRAGSKHNQADDVRAIVAALAEESGVEVVPIINEEFQRVLDELRAHARKETKEMGSTVMRLLQVEEHLKRHLGKRAGASAEG